MAYNIRNENGLLIATVDNDFAHKVINGAAGFFRSMKVKPGVEKTVYEITGNMKSLFLGFEFYLWKGYLLVPE